MHSSYPRIEFGISHEHCCKSIQATFTRVASGSLLRNAVPWCLLATYHIGISHEHCCKPIRATFKITREAPGSLLRNAVPWCIPAIHVFNFTLRSAINHCDLTHWSYITLAFERPISPAHLLGWSILPQTASEDELHPLNHDDDTLLYME